MAYHLVGSRGRFAVVFHGIASQKYAEIPVAAQPHLDVAQLAQILAWLRGHYVFLSPDEFLYSSQPGVLLTFDDGFSNNFRNALPVLTRFNAPAIFFVTTQHVMDSKDWLPATRSLAQLGGSHPAAISAQVAEDIFDGMTNAQVAACAHSPLITIGSHSVSHAFLTRCDRAQVQFELEQSKSFLEKAIGRRVDLFAYPTGDYDASVVQQTQQAGYRAAFALDPRSVGIPHLEIPRVGIYASRPSYLGAKLCGLYRRPLTRPVFDRQPDSEMAF